MVIVTAPTADVAGEMSEKLADVSVLEVTVAPAGIWKDTSPKAMSVVPASLIDVRTSAGGHGSDSGVTVAMEDDPGDGAISLSPADSELTDGIAEEDWVGTGAEDRLHPPASARLINAINVSLLLIAIIP